MFCRVCDEVPLEQVLSLGRQALTGVFPASISEMVSFGLIRLGTCPQCSLVQLMDDFEPFEMYGDGYGYQSSLNETMVSHLKAKLRRLQDSYSLGEDSSHLDIGSNDGTLLVANDVSKTLVGIDPTARSFLEQYPSRAEVLVDFFPTKLLDSSRRFDLVTCIAMFYDLPDPASFLRGVKEILSSDGVLHIEVSYLLTMMRTGAYDSICHEHTEYYSLKVLQHLLRKFDLRIVTVSLNSVNGGSIAIDVCHDSARWRSDHSLISWVIRQEDGYGLQHRTTFSRFEERVQRHRTELWNLLDALHQEGKVVYGYGASTKGNVLLQYCNLTPEQLPKIAERNTRKFGKFTPGTRIPIVSEEEARDDRPDFFLVLPWHFRNSIIEREENYLSNGGRLVFPLPEIEII